MNKKYWVLLISCFALIILFNQGPMLSLFEKGKRTPPKNLSEEIAQLKSRPFNDPLFKQSFQTLIYNNHIHEAYQLAIIAVQKKPSLLFWHEKLALSAGWAEDFNTAMIEWLYVARHTKDLKTIRQAAEISNSLGYDEVTVQILTIYLRYKPDAIKEKLILAYAQNRANHPNIALRLLNELNKTQPSRESYELTATIYQDINHWNNALTTWKKLDRLFGPSVKSSMAESEIYYSRKQFKRALNSLKPAIPIAKSTDKAFWNSLSLLAWMLNDYSLAALGFSHLQNQPNALVGLILLYQDAHPEKALEYSLEGWRQYHTLSFANYSLNLAAQTKQWDKLNSVINSLTPEQSNELEKSDSFWEQRGAMYAALGRQDIQTQLLIQGILTHPDLVALRTDLLFIFISQGDLRRVKELMEDGYEHNLWLTPDSWKVYADSFVVLNQFFVAMNMYQKEIFKNLHYDQLLIDYAGILESAKLYQQAYSLWHYLWRRSIDSYKKQTEFNKSLVQTLGQLSVYFVSGTEQVNILKSLFYPSLTKEDINVLLNWMVPRNYFELITYFKGFYLDNILPVWAGSNLALAHNDLPTLQKSLEHSDKAWSKSDLFNAAVRMENIPLALDLGFKELTERPDETVVYTEFSLYGIINANYLSLGEEYKKFVNVAGPRTIAKAKFRLNNTWKLVTDLSLWKLHSTQLDSIDNVPSNDTYGDLRLHQKIFHGTVIYSLGYRNDLSGFVPASLDVEYQYRAKWTAEFKLALNQQSFQNAYLLEGGVQDQINMGVIGILTKYDQLDLELQGLNYYSQDRHYLGNGGIVSGSLQHKFWLGYPDYTLGLFGNIYLFNRNGTFGGNVTRLFPVLPPEILADPSLRAAAIQDYYQQLIPNSYSEGGLTFSIGNTILDYTHTWRPFLQARLYYNSITLISNEIKAGINGSVFGRDSLLIYGEYGTAQTVQNQTNYSFGMRYKLYY